LLFTCAAVRAVHLELVDSLNLNDTINAIRRFCARRGVPSIFCSDNAKTFIAASKQLMNMFGPICPQWKFSLPRSPWWGGWWERLVRSVKSGLKKSIGLRCLTRSELETFLHEVEACVNSRPLTFSGDGIDDQPALTPSHFLIGRNSSFREGSTVSADTEFSKKTLDDLKLVLEGNLNKFWHVWSTDYVRNLPVWKGPGKTSNIGVDTLVLIREDGSPRMKWPLGLITEIFPGKDGEIRSCKVKTKQGCFLRPVQRLHVLELDDNSEFQEMEACGLEENVRDMELEEVEVQPTPRRSRFGRRIKEVVKLNL
jgi:hypothetical protein